ncbi:peptidase [Microtetraspora sp. NBRC 13810]|uniref:S8 family peptidase n=1 Tax=Microtetraspora sp. NBRC 13810 TaxID=3030990 RepID=UPI0024A08BEA|nr:S8 family serine peptidase [Microtetraspora sp. NBRC 13810]GLW09208.1 peptidase [Microtetraspora sp. NBRC 13810]
MGLWVARRRFRIRRTATAVRLAAAVTVTTMAVTAPVPPAAAAPGGTAAPPDTGTVRPVPGGPGEYDITLITGDRVHVTVGADGRQRATVTPAPREDRLPSGFHVMESGGELSVIPGDVRGLIPQRLDPDLFNVTSLAAQGYTDDRSGSLPLILAHATGAGTGGGAAVKAAIPALTPVRDLESIGATAVTLDKSGARGLGTALSRLAGTADGTAAADPLGGVSKIWLDRKVATSLDRSVPQISAPAAWDAGYDGTGTTVAVLDSGVDAKHPDLAGKVAGERDFTGEGTTGDLLGHGTHVAGIIAGAGTASGGRLKGVAPGARLLNARVLNASGQGLTSWIVDGMEWAAGEQRADVVNMSLADPQPGGPLTDAVGELTERYGTLFVVAAGNHGCGVCVGSPGDAADALTVGAVDTADALADFSSYGPVGLARMVKPEVTAPGVGIVAARGSGTEQGEPVDDAYTRISGTSMATPHVAGAAALLRQARPGIAAGELKALLMGTAKPRQDTAVDRQGMGRIDVAAALADPVLASAGVLDFGEGPAARARDLTYRNPAAVPVTLDLRAGDAFTVTPATLTLPAGGKATVKVAFDPAKAAAGRQRAELVATPRGGAAVRTLLTGVMAPERVQLRMTGVARDGRPAAVYARAFNVQDGAYDGRELPSDPVQRCDDWSDASVICLMVPPGTYSVLGVVATSIPSEAAPGSGDRGTVLHHTLAGDPEVEVTRDTAVVLDARKAVEVRIETPDHETKRNPGAATKLSWAREPVHGTTQREGFLPAGTVEERFFVQPTDRVAKGEFTVATRWRLEAPDITLRAPGLTLNPEYYDPVWFSDLSAEYPRLDGTARLTAVDAGRGTPQELRGRDLRGRLAVIRRDPGVPVSAQSNAAAAAGAAMVAVYSDRPGVDVAPGGTGVKLRVPTLRLSHEEGRALAERSRRGSFAVRAEGVVASPYVYDLHLREEGRVPDQVRHVVRAKSLARIDSGFHGLGAAGMTASEMRYAWEPGDASSMDRERPLLAAPRVRTDYVTADPDVRWSASVGAPEQPYNSMFERPETPSVMLAVPGQRSFKPGERTSRTFFKQVMTPGIHPEAPPYRQGDTLIVDMQAFVDAAGNTATGYTSPFPAGLVTDFRLYQGDDLVVRTGSQPAGGIPLPAAGGRYRMEYTVENRAPWNRLSTRTRSVWTFDSARPAAGATTVVPLLLAGYDAPVDLSNRATSGTLGLTFGHPSGAPGSPVRSVTLDVSYDDGATWQPVRRLRPKGGNGYEATLDRPRPGAVSLRLNATDARGATLTQEVIRAYTFG